MQVRGGPGFLRCCKGPGLLCYRHYLPTCPHPAHLPPAVFVPLGRSGGLLAGIAAVLKAADPAIKVVGVYPAVSAGARLVVWCRLQATDLLVPAPHVFVLSNVAAVSTPNKLPTPHTPRCTPCPPLQRVERLRGMLSGRAAGEELPGGMADLADEVVSVTEEEAARAAVDTVSHSGLQVDGEWAAGAAW